MRYLSVAVLAALAVTALPGGERFGAALAQEPKLDGTRPLTDPLVCLARTIYFEASGQGTEEMAAVGYVVVNRARDSDFPDDICAVIREGGETPPCQFSWWCDGRSDVATNREEYDRAVRVARGILDGTTADPSNGANMFHNLSASPGWAREAEKRGRIGDQIFYYLDNR
jgi:spore germination cell wall hydrolase CwlJ-like protein